MAENPPQPSQAAPVPMPAQRLFEQGPDAVSFYSDLVQVLNTGSEVVFQFYETIPGPPTSPAGQITHVRTRLRATIQLSPGHALNIANNILGQMRVAANKPGA